MTAAYLPMNGADVPRGFQAACGKRVMVYGQTEVTRDLYDAQDAIGATSSTEAEDVAPA